MTATQKYEAWLKTQVDGHCPTLRELEEATGISAGAIANRACALAETGELEGTYPDWLENWGYETDFAPADVPLVLRDLE